MSIKNSESLFEVQTEIRVRFSEVDSMGVVWHGNYLKYFEDGREAFGRKHGLGYVLTSDATGLASWQTLNTSVWQLAGNSGTNSATNFIGTTDAKALAFRTDNTERMIILQDGRIGIGTNTNLTEKLNVNGGQWPSYTKMENDNGWTKIGFNGAHGIIESDHAILINYYNGNDVVVGGTTGNFTAVNNVFLATNTNKKVGIGTTTPPALLTINGGQTNSSGITVKSGDVDLVFTEDAGTNEGKIQVFSGGDASTIGTAPYRLLIQPEGGNVGIGTVNPGAKLYIQGGQLKVNEAETGAGELRVGAAWGYPGIYGESTTKPLVLGSAFNNIYMNANVGIGTETFDEKLNVFGTGKFFNNDGFVKICFNGAHGIIESDHAILINYYNGNDVVVGGITGNFEAVNNVYLATHLNNKVGIGTTQLDAYSILTVNGKITAKEIEVVQNMPDYVFEKDYPLMSLKELEDSIYKNKHLPEVPSAEYFKNNGLQLGEMNALLLKKIEEQTLYIIGLNKRIDDLEKLILSK